MQALPPGFVLDKPANTGPLISPAKAVDPYKDEDQQFQREEAARKKKEFEDRNNPQLPKGFMWKNGQVGSEAVLIPGVPAPKGSGGGSLDPKTVEGQSNIAGLVLNAAGVRGGVDPVADLIRGSTSGQFQSWGAQAYGAATGESTEGMENIGRLQTIANDMVLQMSGGSLGAQISDGDRKFIAARMGDVGNPEIPYNQRLAAWDQVKKRLMSVSGQSESGDQQDLGISVNRDEFGPDGVMINPSQGDPGKGPDGGVPQYDKASDIDITGGVPTGSEIQWGGIGNNFDRKAWLASAYNWTPNEESRAIAWLNANNGKRLSAQQIAIGLAKAGVVGTPKDTLADIASKLSQPGKWAAFKPQEQTDWENRVKQLKKERKDAVVDPVVRGVADTASVGLADKAAALGNTIFKGGTYEENMNEERAINAADEAENPYLRIGGQIGGGFLAPGMAAVRTPQGAAKAGAAYSGAYNFNTTQGDVGDRLASGAQGALMGGVVGFAAGKGANALNDKLAAGAARKAENALAQNVDTPNVNALLADAKTNKIPLMTSDVKPPRTAVGKSARKLGEMIPVAGTGAPRVAQQNARIEAVKSLADEYGVSGASLDDVAKDLAETRGAQLTHFTAQKNQILNNITAPAVSPKAIAMLDQQIAAASKVKTDGSKALVSKLQNFRTALQEPGNTLKQVEAIRREMGTAFDDPSLATIKSEGDKVLRAVYGPLKEDMAGVIKAAGGDETARTWRVANARLASMADELQSSALKSTLKKASSTPEDVAKLLFSAKPSQVRLLYSNLSNEGRVKAQGVIIGKALEKAGDSPDKFANEIDRLSKSVGVFFQDADLARVNGLNRVLQETKRAGQAGVLPENGSQLLPWAIPAGLTGTFGISGGASAAVGAGLLARLYESAPVRNALLKLGRTKPGSPQERNVMPSVMAAIAAANDNPSIKEFLANAPSAAKAAASDDVGEERPVKP